MFVNNESNSKIYADLDKPIVKNTLKNCVLIPEFLRIICDTNDFLRMYNNASKILGHDFSDSNPKWNSEEMMCYLEELFYVMNMYAPEDYYFGFRSGDDVDFGYWKCSEDE